MVPNSSVPNQYPSTLLFDTYLGRISAFENNHITSRCSEKQHCAHMSHGEATGGPGIEASSVWSHAYPSLPIPPNTLWGSVFGPPWKPSQKVFVGWHTKMTRWSPHRSDILCLKWHDLNLFCRIHWRVFSHPMFFVECSAAAYLRMWFVYYVIELPVEDLTWAVN